MVQISKEGGQPTTSTFNQDTSGRMAAKDRTRLLPKLWDDNSTKVHRNSRKSYIVVSGPFVFS